MLKLNEFVKRYDKALFILGLAVIVLLMLGFTNAFAGSFNYGVGTYEQYDDILVVNSLGDEPNISTYGTLGANDFIPENAFKNILGYEGYSVAYDYNPTYKGLYSGIYETALPGGVALTKLQIGGLAGNPRAKQDVYVLTSEYNRLSATGQAINIDNLNLGLSNEVTNRTNADNILQNGIDDVKNDLTTEAKQRKKADIKLGNRITNETNSRIKADTKEKQQRIAGDKKLDNKINTETKQRKQADTKLDNKIIKETKDRKSADKTLQSNINKEITQRKTADKILQKNINNETKNRKDADKILQNNINTETKERKSADKTEKTARILGDKKLQDNINIVDNNSISRDNTLQTNINNEATTRATADNNLQTNINNVNSRVDDVSNRVSKLEATQYVVKTELKFIREKHLEVGVYTEYNAGRNVCSEVGLNIVIPIGESYQDRENKKINTRLTALEQKVGTSAVIERTLDSKGKVKSISISQAQLAVSGEF